MSFNEMPMSNAIAIDKDQVVPRRPANRLVQDLGLSKTNVLVPHMANGKSVPETVRYLDDHVLGFLTASVIGNEHLVREAALLRQAEESQF